MVLTNRDASTGLAWIWSFHSGDAHACAERDLFTEYTKFPSQATSSFTHHGSRKMSVAGVGSIDLPVQSTQYPDGRRGSLATLRLNRVLHVPELPFNVVARTDDTSNWGWCSEKRTNGFIHDAKDQRVAAFRPIGKNYVIHECNPFTGQALNPPVPNIVHRYEYKLVWPKAERDRWQALNADMKASPAPKSEGVSELGGKDEASKGASKPANAEFEASDDVPPYVGIEMLCLKALFGSEKRFLLIYGLNPYKPEHRGEGRRIARAIISHQLQRDESIEDMDPEEGPPDYSDPRCKFSGKEVDFINERWGNTGDLMRALRLDVCNEGDWEKAKLQAQ
ncbi:hypothetical protein F5Y08DRAFT_323116 [Xylaria arbuscula]|nr:hypothetical protein F5Y08DRAFT_323116 [Xylaria arbuscula]